MELQPGVGMLRRPGTAFEYYAYLNPYSKVTNHKFYESLDLGVIEKSKALPSLDAKSFLSNFWHFDSWQSL